MVVLLQASSSSERLRHSDLHLHPALAAPYGSRLLANSGTPSPPPSAIAVAPSALGHRTRHAAASASPKQAPLPFYTKRAELGAIATEDQFHEALAQARDCSQPIIINWTAAWCRKCIHLKPKLEKLATEYKNVKFYSVDVNKVPQALVNWAEVTKMPTIQLWENGKKQDEVIGGHQAWLVVNEVREMLEQH